jgi:hypothetical protein
MSEFRCSRCGAPATHSTPLSGTGLLNDYRCPKHKGPHGFSPIPGVSWPRRRMRPGALS